MELLFGTFFSILLLKKFQKMETFYFFIKNKNTILSPKIANLVLKTKKTKKSKTEDLFAFFSMIEHFYKKNIKSSPKIAILTFQPYKISFLDGAFTPFFTPSF